MNKFDSIFVRGLSRSGGTLLATLLDSHKKISLSYYDIRNTIDLFFHNVRQLSKQFKYRWFKF